MSEIEVLDPEPQEARMPAVQRSHAIVARDEITVQQLLGQAAKVKEAMRLAMVDGVHYGKVPGVSKPTLLKPGAETLLVLLRLAPYYESEKIWQDEGHLTVAARVTLRHIPTGMIVAQGEGMCSTRETKYAYRQQSRVCPACGMEAIIKGKAEYGGGWVCFKKKDGCGAKYADDDTRITDQAVGKMPNPDLPDTYNTVLKMADKRALVAAVLNGTAASDIFTQDVEDGQPPSDDTPVSAEPDPPAVKQPRSYVEWQARMLELGVPGAEEWARQAVEASGVSEGKMKRLNEALTALVIAEFDPFSPDPDGQVRAAFALAFGGVVVDGPPKDPYVEDADIPFGEGEDA